ncbi:hypothetical protein GIY62_29210 [Burkholderia plantarii]|uniref:hypothetical protein n=1 Tax=Burkholderia plantarii TaxID=41899 RepID=UPI00272ABF8E|nr:hypothetical protein [Burkholderia plantarii]WLE61542.1 hypothetical protein GIY62_29210 [Burkholderia plantarii]
MAWAARQPRATPARPDPQEPDAAAPPAAAQARQSYGQRSYAQATVVPRMRAAEPPPPISPPAPIPLPARQPDHDARALAARAFDRFLAAFRDETGASREAPDRAAWRDRLERALASEELVGIRARDLFEYRFATLLAQGWKRGHEVLFTAAVEVFQWDADRVRLRAFGQAGALLERALQERATFDHQPAKRRQSQRLFIQRLRDPGAPTRRELQSDFLPLKRIVDNYPTWLAMVTDTGRLAAWREAYVALPQRAQRASERGAARQEGGSIGGRWRYVGAVLFIGAVIRLAGYETPAMRASAYQQQQQQQQATGTDRRPSIATSLVPWAPARAASQAAAAAADGPLPLAAPTGSARAYRAAPRRRQGAGRLTGRP